MTTSADTILTRAGEAGRCGADIRSDLRVRLEPRASGGIQLELVSRVELYYGEAIRRQAGEVLRELGIEHARVLIEDSGALPFVIGARIEAAARRAGLSSARRVLPKRVCCRRLLPRTGCAARGCIFPAASPSTSSMPRSTSRTRSF